MKKDGMILWSLFSMLWFLTISPTPTFTQDKTSILFNWKDWGTCSEQERDSLRSRWTDEKIPKVVSALKTGTQLPDYVNKISGRNSSAGYDLRGIKLIEINLDSVVLSHMYLDGAILTNSYFIEAVFDSASLEYATLRGTDLQGADLQNASLDGASLGYANLKGAHLERANFQGANLWYANLQRANLQETDLQGAKLWHANLQRAILRNTSLKEADLFAVRFDTTDLWLTKLGEAQNIRDIVWGDSLHDCYLIYGEIMGDTQHMINKRAITLKHTEITYRDLKAIYKKEGMEEVANEFNFRENEVKTKRSPWYWRYPRIFFFKWTYGYGSRPLWLLWDSLYVVGGFMVIFILLTLNSNRIYRIFSIYRVEGDNKRRNKRVLAWRTRKRWLLWDCFIFSLLSFSTFGYGALQLKHLWELFHLEPVEYKPIRLARILVGIEAGLGILLFAFLVKWLFGRG